MYRTDLLHVHKTLLKLFSLDLIKTILYLRLYFIIANALKDNTVYNIHCIFPLEEVYHNDHYKYILINTVLL